ncbi:MAG: GDP-mannose 4,6-dehydratase [Chloroflexota bacterium]
MSKSFLVTGAAGFIGSNVAETLIARGDQVVGLDNINDYYTPDRKRANIAEVKDTQAGSSFTFIEGDIRDRALLTQIFDDHHFDAVVHLAAMAGVRASLDDPQLYYDVNLNGTLALLDVARHHATQNFVLASTSSVYGETKQIPFIESDVCDRPLAPYSASKRAAELLGYTYHHVYGQNFTGLRFFTVYGPRGRPDMMTYKVLENIFTGVPAPIFNNGQMYRDWTYVDDIVAGVVAAADRPLGYELINLGRGEPVLLSDFVGIIEGLTGRKAHLTSAPMPSTDIPYTYADISKARELLDYDPHVSVTEGVTRFWQWYERAVLQKR